MTKPFIRSLLFTVVLSALTLSSTHAQTPPAIPPQLQDILTHLGDDQFPVRQKAQADLEKVPPSQHDLLKSLADATTNPEVKSRLQTRVEEIDTELAIDPPPISIDLKNASLSDAATALSKAIGFPIEAWPPQAVGRPGGSYTLHAVDEPFWNVVADLSKQNSFQIDIFDHLRLMQTEEVANTFVRVRGMAVFPLFIQRFQQVDLQQPAGRQATPPRLSFQYRLAFDPRIDLIRIADPSMKVVDDVGNVLADQPPQKLHDLVGDHNSTQHCAVDLAMPNNPGRKIASAQGRVTVEVAVGYTDIDIDNFSQNYKKPIKLGNHELVFHQFRVGRNSIDYFYDIRPIAGDPDQTTDAESSNSEPPSNLSLIDATGQVIWSYSHATGSRGGIEGQNFAQPLKLRVSTPLKTKTIELTFELKDLLLPSK